MKNHIVLPNYDRTSTGDDDLPPDEVAPERKKYKRRRAPKMRKKFLRDTMIMRACLPTENGGEGLSVSECARRYGMTRIAVYQILKKPDVKALEQEWLQDMFTRHRNLGDDAIKATAALIKGQDARTVADYWHRMGVSREPSLNVDVEKLEINAPADFLKAIREVAGGAPDTDG